MRLRCVFLGILLFLASPATARQDATFDRLRRLDAREQNDVLVLARRAFDAYIQDRRVIAPPFTLPEYLSMRSGVFVSSMRHGAPRCCMGTLYAMQPNAALEIIENAVAAAGRDRRFPPIRLTDAASLTLIVSFVGKPVPISANDLSALDPTRDGLVVTAGGRSGVVLSGETSTVDRMLMWGRIRAGARDGADLELFRLPVVRFVENKHGDTRNKNGTREMQRSKE